MFLKLFRPAFLKQKNHAFEVGRIYMYIFFACCWIFVAARGLSLVAASGGYTLVHGLLIVVASLVAELGLQARGLQ